MSIDNGQDHAQQFISQANDLISKGFSIAWTKPGEKRPLHKGWSTFGQKPDDYRPGCNLGILTGWLSAMAVGVDLDSAQAIELADKYLPSTKMVDGRPGKPRSHRWYRVEKIPEEHECGYNNKRCQAFDKAAELGINAGPRTRHFNHAETRKVIIDFLGTGSFLTVPPTVVSDEQRIWYEYEQASLYTFTELWAQVELLAEACGWRRPSEIQRRAKAAIDLLPPAISGEGGRSRTYRAARILVNDFKLPGEDAWPVFKEWNDECDPPWSEDELNKELRAAIENGLDPRFPHGQGKATIQLGLDVKKTCDEAIRALLDEPALFQRDNKLVHIVRLTDEDAKQPETDESGKIVLRRKVYRYTGTPRISEIAFARLKEMLANIAYWQKYTGKDGAKVCKRCQVTDEIVGMVFGREQWPGIRHLKAVVEVPVLKPDGTILSQEGYDASTGLFFAPNCPVHMPHEITVDDAKAAITELYSIVVDFPFAEPEHKSGWLAYLLTPLARYAFDGPTPLTLIDGNTAGVGKGLLCNIVSLIFSGRKVAISPASADNVEMTKIITSIAISGDPMIVFDNVSGTFGCSALDAVLTGEAWRARKLGGNEQTDVLLHTIWAATANNAALAGDMHRRTLYIKLDSRLPNPEDRNDFTIRDLQNHVLINRSKLLRAALMILRGYCIAGCPDMGLVEWGSFTEWSKVVRAAIVWAGEPDPNKTRIAMRSSIDVKSGALECILSGLATLSKSKPEKKGWSTREIVEWCAKCSDDAAKAMREALDKLGARFDSDRSVSIRLSELKGKMAMEKDSGKCRRLTTKSGHAGSVLWYIEWE